MIVGGGIIGLCSAWEAAQRGFRVTVLDASPADREGCSFGNAGMIVPSHVVPLAAPGAVALGLKWMWNPESPFYIKPRLSPELFKWGWHFWRSANQKHVDRSAPLLRELHMRSRANYDRWRQSLGGFGLVQRGLIMFCATEEALHEEEHGAKLAKSLGLEADVLTPAQLKELEPGLTMNVVGGVLHRQDCHLNPNRLMALLRERIVASGGEIRPGTEVSDFRKSGSKIVAAQTAQGEVEGDQFVLAGGVWSSTIARSLRLKLPMQAGKGYSLTLSQPKELPQYCSILTEARVAVTPIGSSLRFGGTMAMAGRDESILEPRIRGILRSIPKYFPKFEASDFANIKPWVGLRPVSPDGMPYLGRARDWSNLVIATGHAMMGISLGPVTGELVSQILVGEKPSIELAQLKPERFG